MSELVEALPALAVRPHESAHETGFWVDRFTAEWRVDRKLTTMDFCRRYPHLADDFRLQAVIGYEEFCLRSESGEKPGREFLLQFPDGGAGLSALMGVHGYMGGHGSFLPGLLQLPPELLDNLDEAARSDWPAPPETVAGYELLELLGRGGFARVYLAEELALGRRKVALKVSKAATVEAHALGKLRHANIVPVYSVGYDACRKLSLICMPFLGRATLDDVLGRLFRDGRRPRFAKDLLAALAEIESVAVDAPSALDAANMVDPRLAKGSYVDAVVHLGAQLADALCSSHRENICHCDLKPSNILLDRSGKPMLLDFHLSSTDGECAHWGGTLHYVAPEVVNQVIEGARRPTAADPRCDIYSLGVVLYELLCGKDPFGEQTNERVTPEVMRALYERQQKPLAPINERNKEVEPALANLIARCVSFDAEARPPTAEHVARTLRRLAGRRGRLRRWAWRHRRALRLAQAAACLGIAVLGYLFVGRPPYAQRQFQAAQLAAGQGDYQTALARLGSAETAGYQPEAVVELRGDVYYRRATQAFLSGDYRAASDHCSLVLELEPANWHARMLRARAQLRLSDVQAALADADCADASSSAPEIAALHGDCFCAQHQWKFAIDAYRFATNAGFESAGLYNNLAHALAKSNRREEALPWLDRALELEHLPDAYYQRASIAIAFATDRRLALPAQAMADIQAAITLSPANYRLHLVAANIYAVAAEHGGGMPDRHKSRQHLLESLRLGLRANEVPISGPLAAIAAECAADAEYRAAIACGAGAQRAPAPGLVDSLANMPLE